MKKYKLITGETINYDRVATIEEYIEVLNKNIIWSLLVVDKDNFLKALKSIKFNGVRETEVKTIEDLVYLLIDYVTVQETETGYYYIILMLDDQELCVSYILNKDETEAFKKLTNESARYNYIINLMLD